MTTNLRRIALAVLAATLTLTGACDPKAPTRSRIPGPTPPAAIPANGYLIHIAVLDRDAQPAIRDVDCTVAAYSGKSAILVIDPKTGRAKPHQLTMTLELPDENILHIYDPPSAADRIDYLCTMTGYRGDSIDCEVTFANDRIAAPLISSKDFGLIELDTGQVSCSGSINARESK